MAIYKRNIFYITFWLFDPATSGLFEIKFCKIENENDRPKSNLNIINFQECYIDSLQYTFIYWLACPFRVKTRCFTKWTLLHSYE